MDKINEIVNIIDNNNKKIIDDHLKSINEDKKEKEKIKKDSEIFINEIFNIMNQNIRGIKQYNLSKEQYVSEDVVKFVNEFNKNSTTCYILFEHKYVKYHKIDFDEKLNKIIHIFL